MASNSQRSTAEHHFLTLEEHAVDGAYRSEAGPTRQTNEDCAALVIPKDPIVLDAKGVLALVADGMGGHEGGEVASELAATLVPQRYYSYEHEPRESLVTAFDAANLSIFSRAAAEHKLVGMGTTCTALVLRHGLAWCAHVGDSRAYLVRNGNVYRMTQDHSATMDLVSKGLLSLAEARHHEDRNVILRAMGTHRQVEISGWKDPFPVLPGDFFVLCSDGLHDSISDDEIGELCIPGVSPQSVCDSMVQLAVEREASDNVTAVVLHVSTPSTRETGESILPGIRDKEDLE
jgi:protein phosphatase